MSKNKEECIVICPLKTEEVFPKCCDKCIFVIRMLDSGERIGCAIRRNVRLLSERQKFSRKSLNKINNLKRRMMNGSR